MISLGLSATDPEGSRDKPRHFGFSREFVFVPTTLDHHYRPVRGLLYSFLVHEIVFFGLLFLSFSGTLSELTRRPDQSEFLLDRISRREVIYLPALGDPGGSAGDDGAGDEEPAPARRTEGLSYHGPQRIVSQFPEPDNTFQTILRPALLDPPRVELPVSAPNIVQIADAGLIRQPDELPMPGFRPPETPPETPPEIPIELKPLDPLLPPPNPVELSARVSRGPDMQNLLSISPMPGLADPGAIPPGEARGNFAISPEANAGSSATDPGAANGNAPDGAAAGLGTGAGTGGGTGDSASGGGRGSGSGSGGGSGNGTGSGSGTGSGTGSGAGTGGGGNPFAGITIIGGSLDTGRAPTPGRSPSVVNLGPSAPAVQPVWAADLARRYPRGLVIVFGVINAEGRLEQLSVKQSPDELLNGAAMDAVKKWVFRPARLNGQAVPVKALFGVPVWAE